MISPFPVSAMHRVKLEDAYVEWNTISQVFLHRENASSKFDRAVRSKLGLSKGKGGEIYTGHISQCSTIIVENSNDGKLRKKF